MLSSSHRDTRTSMKDEFKLQIFENIATRKIFGPNKEAVSCIE
jgi:hypothetical protein